MRNIKSYINASREKGNNIGMYIVAGQVVFASQQAALENLTHIIIFEISQGLEKAINMAKGIVKFDKTPDSVSDTINKIMKQIDKLQTSYDNYMATIELTKNEIRKLKLDSMSIDVADIKKYSVGVAKLDKRMEDIDLILQEYYEKSDILKKMIEGDRQNIPQQYLYYKKHGVEAMKKGLRKIQQIISKLENEKKHHEKEKSKIVVQLEHQKTIIEKMDEVKINNILEINRKENKIKNVESDAEELRQQIIQLRKDVKKQNKELNKVTMNYGKSDVDKLQKFLDEVIYKIITPGLGGKVIDETMMGVVMNGIKTTYKFSDSYEEVIAKVMDYIKDKEDWDAIDYVKLASVSESQFRGFIKTTVGNVASNIYKSERIFNKIDQFEDDASYNKKEESPSSNQSYQLDDFISDMVENGKKYLKTNIDGIVGECIQYLREKFPKNFLSGWVQDIKDVTKGRYMDGENVDIIKRAINSAIDYMNVEMMATKSIKMDEIISNVIKEKREGNPMTKIIIEVMKKHMIGFMKDDVKKRADEVKNMKNEEDRINILRSLSNTIKMLSVRQEKVEKYLLNAGVKTNNEGNISIYDFIEPKKMVLNLRGLKIKNADIPNWEKRERRELGEPDGSDDTTGAYSNMVYYENRFNASDFSEIVNNLVNSEIEKCSI